MTKYRPIAGMSRKNEFPRQTAKPRQTGNGRVSPHFSLYRRGRRDLFLSKPFSRRIYAVSSPLAASKKKKKLVDAIRVAGLNYLSKDKQWNFQVILKGKETL